MDCTGERRRSQRLHSIHPHSKNKENNVENVLNAMNGDEDGVQFIHGTEGNFLKLLGTVGLIGHC